MIPKCLPFVGWHEKLITFAGNLILRVVKKVWAHPHLHGNITSSSSATAPSRTHSDCWFSVFPTQLRWQGCAAENTSEPQAYAKTGNKRRLGNTLILSSDLQLWLTVRLHCSWQPTNQIPLNWHPQSFQRVNKFHLQPTGSHYPNEL